MEQINEIKADIRLDGALWAQGGDYTLESLFLGLGDRLRGWNLTTIFSSVVVMERLWT